MVHFSFLRDAANYGRGKENHKCNAAWKKSKKRKRGELPRKACTTVSSKLINPRLTTLAKT